MQQLIRYGLVGVTINVLLYVFYLLVTKLGLEPKVSMSLAYIFGVSIGFYSHRKLTFSYVGDSRQSMSRYFIAHFLGYFINFFILLSLVDYFGYPHEFVQGAAILVVAAFLFVLFKYWVFAGKSGHVIK